MGLEGRGTGYSRARGAVEWTLARAYKHDWPARLAHSLGLQGHVDVIRHRVHAPVTMRLAFGSDFHAGPTTHPALLDAAAEALAGAHADILLLGGDYVFLSSREIDAVTDRLRAVPAPRGKFAVLGNHDLWANDRHITRALERAGIRVLVNEAVNVDGISICGVDDPWTGMRDDARAFEGADGYRVLLTHAPEALMTIGDAAWQLALCGHTHGGHIALPGGVPIIVPGPLGRRFAHGRYSLNGGTLIVSRGIGATESPIRWNAAPDVLVIDLAREDADAVDGLLGHR